MTLYVFHINFGHNIHGFRDISVNRSQKPKLDLSDLEKMTLRVIAHHLYFNTVLTSLQ